MITLCVHIDLILNFDDQFEIKLGVTNQQIMHNDFLYIRTCFEIKRHG